MVHKKACFACALAASPPACLWLVLRLGKIAFYSGIGRNPTAVACGGDNFFSVRARAPRDALRVPHRHTQKTHNRLKPLSPLLSPLPLRSNGTRTVTAAMTAARRSGGSRRSRRRTKVRWQQWLLLLLLLQQSCVVLF